MKNQITEFRHTHTVNLLNRYFLFGNLLTLFFSPCHFCGMSQNIHCTASTISQWSLVTESFLHSSSSNPYAMYVFGPISGFRILYGTLTGRLRKSHQESLYS